MSKDLGVVDLIAAYIAEHQKHVPSSVLSGMISIAVPDWMGPSNSFTLRAVVSTVIHESDDNPHPRQTVHAHHREGSSTYRSAPTGEVSYP